MTRYTAALAALIDPTPDLLMRETAPTRARLAELAEQHIAHVRHLRRRLRLAGAKGDATAAERALCAMTLAGDRYRATKAALTAPEPDPPSLLEQLRQAVYGTGGSNGAAGVGAHRAPANLAALDLVLTICRYFGVGEDNLDGALRHWQPADEITAAARLDTWAAAIVALLDPPHNLEGVAPCPACGERYVSQLEGDEWIRRAAIRIVIHRTGSPIDDYAECLAEACRARWERARWNLLAAAMTTPDLPHSAQRVRSSAAPG